MAEMTGHDARHGWDLLYSMSGAVPEPDAEVRAIVSVLRDLVGDGPVLELAVGDGRIAVPLAALGVDVDGIDLSPKGVENIRVHPQGATVNASVADISDFELPRKYSLIYCVANSLFNVPTQDGQLACFERVASHLAPGGVFFVHSSYTPRWFETLRNSQYVDAKHFELNLAWFQSGRIDPAAQRLYQQDMWFTKAGVKLIPSVHRYASLGELDLMARIAGLQRRDVWGGWTREPYTADSPMFLATYTAA
jgi:ubiquinone/menaquinone biosynthesis C-methylase UbiE